VFFVVFMLHRFILRGSTCVLWGGSRCGWGTRRSCRRGGGSRGSRRSCWGRGSRGSITSAQVVKELASLEFHVVGVASCVELVVDLTGLIVLVDQFASGELEFLDFTGFNVEVPDLSGIQIIVDITSSERAGRDINREGKDAGCGVGNSGGEDSKVSGELHDD
jgi:hypothetical protein